LKKTHRTGLHCGLQEGRP
jgi:hypothetical protein